MQDEADMNTEGHPAGCTAGAAGSGLGSAAASVQNVSCLCMVPKVVLCIGKLGSQVAPAHHQQPAHRQPVAIQVGLLDGFLSVCSALPDLAPTQAR